MGRQFIIAFYGAVRAIKLYPVENAAVQRALDDLTTACRTILDSERELEFRTSGEYIFINSTRLRLDLDNYTSFSHLLSLFRASGIGSLRVLENVTPRNWIVLISALQAVGSDDPGERYFQLAGKLEAAKVTTFEFGPPTEATTDSKNRKRSRDAAKRTVLAVRGRHQRGHQLRSPRPRAQRQEAQARRSRHRRPRS